MKCVCGYEHDRGMNDKGKYVIIIGDEEFIPINIVATIKDDEWIEKRIAIYACPKCGTLKRDV